MNAIVIRQPDKVAEGRAKQHGYEVTVSGGWEMPAGRVLFVAPGTAIPYNLLAAGWRFLERWEAAAPLWRGGILAEQAGTPAERERTQGVTLDLRVPLYAHELLFVRDCEAGRALLERWRAECEGGDERMAFVRALHAVKPLFCALPTSWLAGEDQRARQDARSAAGHKVFAVQGGALTEVRPRRVAPGLVQVQIAPGRSVLCHPGEEEAMRQRFGAAGRRR